MNKVNPIHGAIVVLALALAPPAAAQTGNATSVGDESAANESGTIPAARPGLPEMPNERGAQGPSRSEPRPSTDPSIRPFLAGPDIRNGLWETLAGNQVVRPEVGPEAGNLPAVNQ